MDRRTFLYAVASGAITEPLTAAAQRTGTVPRVGVLYTTAPSVTFNELGPALRELGYFDGANIVLDPRSSAGQPEALSGLATELARLNVAVLVAVGPAAVKAAVKATRSIPIIAVDLESDPVALGWASTLARPSANITGFFMDHPAMAGKWLDLLREAAPSIRQVALLWDSTTGASQLEAAKAAARRFSINADVVQIRNTDDLNAMLNAGVVAGSQAVIVLSSPIVFANSAQIAAFTKRQRLPAISPFRPFAEAGGLMSYGPDLPYFFRRAATYVDKILKGEKPGDLPIQQPTKFEFVINLGTAKALGLTIPQALLVRADQLIQ